MSTRQAVPPGFRAERDHVLGEMGSVMFAGSSHLEGMMMSCRYWPTPDEAGRPRYDRVGEDDDESGHLEVS